MHINDHSPSLFDLIQLEVNPENNFIAQKSPFYYFPNFQMNIYENLFT